MLCVWMLRAIRWSRRAFFPAGLTGLTLGFLLLDGLPAAGHADLLLQIEEITKEIAQRPSDPELYLRRGELRRAHLEWDEALADYQRGQTLSPSLAVVDLMRGRLFLDSGWPVSSVAYVDRFLARHTNNPDAYITRGRAFERLQLRLSAAADFDRAIGISRDVGPDLYIERAQVLAAEGPEHFARALQGLDDGIRKLGSLVVLQLFAIEIEMKSRQFDGALARVDRIAERSPRKETWLARKGEILKQAGRMTEAHKSYQDALTALQTLPPVRRSVPAMAELEKRIRQEIEATASRPDSKPGGAAP
ncbi:MAG TPA: tetratricopeptide repeat protein [Verrucomicrobiae bacterium]|nr:tetratricopeptide repeat protein [Verrucomicrobiae bacterium]